MVLIIVHVLVAIHIALWLRGGETMTPLEPSESMEFSKHSIVNAGLIFFALTILSTLISDPMFVDTANSSTSMTSSSSTTPAPRTIQKPSHKIKVPISRSGSFYSAWILHASSNVAAGVIVAINTAA